LLFPVSRADKKRPHVPPFAEQRSHQHTIQPFLLLVSSPLADAGTIPSTPIQPAGELFSHPTSLLTARIYPRWPIARRRSSEYRTRRCAKWVRWPWAHVQGTRMCLPSGSRPFTGQWRAGASLNLPCAACLWTLFDRCLVLSMAHKPSATGTLWLAW